MNMELGVDSKPKEHPTPEFADNWRFRPLVAGTASWIVEQFLPQLVVYGNPSQSDFARRIFSMATPCCVGAIDVHVECAGCCRRQCNWFHGSIPGVRSRDRNPRLSCMSKGRKAAARVSRRSIERHSRISRRAQSNCLARPPCRAGHRALYRSARSECPLAQESFRCLAR